MDDGMMETEKGRRSTRERSEAGCACPVSWVQTSACSLARALVRMSLLWLGRVWWLGVIVY